jgi:DNA ligase-associated metallophosphoesterase
LAACVNLQFFMQASILHTINNNKFWLSAEKTIFWEEEKALILSDLHLGKSGHFRKAGIPIPQGVMKEDMQRLLQLLHYFKPEQLLVVGDFFHSKANLELDFFKRWRNDISHLSIKLIRGNHDILSVDWYTEATIEVIENDLCIGDFCFTHDNNRPHPDHYTFTGHLHPGVVLNGLGKQSLRFPCFYFTKNYCILPAFGKFTGLANVQPSRSDIVYAIVEKAVIKL